MASAEFERQLKQNENRFFRKAMDITLLIGAAGGLGSVMVYKDEQRRVENGRSPPPCSYVTRPQVGKMASQRFAVLNK